MSPTDPRHTHTAAHMSLPPQLPFTLDFDTQSRAGFGTRLSFHHASAEGSVVKPARQGMETYFSHTGLVQSTWSCRPPLARFAISSLVPYCSICMCRAREKLDKQVQ